MKPNEIIKDIKKGCGSEFSVNDKLCPICQSKLQIAKQMQESFIEMINNEIKLVIKNDDYTDLEQTAIIYHLGKLKQEVEG